MKTFLLTGLGNPGRKYAATRHNIGFVVLDRFAEANGFKIGKNKFQGEYALEELFGSKIVVLKPQNFMNLSGEVVGQFLKYFKIDVSDMLVVHDDIDLPLGTLRVSSSAGHGGHNGVRSIQDWLDTKDFYRLRFGVGRPPEQMDPADYVLARFNEEENEEVTAQMEKALEMIGAFFKNK